MVLGVSGCWAAALEAGGVVVGGGTCVSGAAGSHGFAGDMAAGGWRSRGVSAGCEHRGSSLAQFLAVGGGGRGRRILLEGSVAVLPPPASLRVKN